MFLKQVPFQLKLYPQICYHLEIFSIGLAFSFKLDESMYFDSGEKNEAITDNMIIPHLLPSSPADLIMQSITYHLYFRKTVQCDKLIF